MTADLLREGARKLQVALSEDALGRLHAFAALVRATNAAINLVSRQDIERLETRHVLDSLAAVAVLDELVASSSAGRHLLDVGSGGGFPGIVIAVARPDLAVVLVDRSARKVRFLERVRDQLGLANIETRCHDVQKAPLPERFDLITSRAVAPVSVMWEWLAGNLVDQGVFVHMSFASTVQIPQLPALPGARVDSRELRVPGLDQPHRLTLVRHGEAA
ncbi:MAG: 16S rRNA (guanine(527)-N(7))-methyltransferase RsmG [Pseudomonadales bacterium]